MISRREQWRTELTSLRFLHTRLLEAERILAGDSLTAQGLTRSNATVATAFDHWCETLHQEALDPARSPLERRCLDHFLQVTSNLRPHLIRCYDLEALPRTNNEMEGFIRSIKTRSRRISGRKNWNRYLLRYGPRVAFYEAHARLGNLPSIEAAISGLSPARWRAARLAQHARQQEQLKQFRIRSRRAHFLAALEAAWVQAHPCV